MPRCCAHILNEYSPSYASTLVSADNLQADIAALELQETNNRPLPCITAWCRRCRRTSLLTQTLETFPSPSAHHAHMLVLSRTLRSCFPQQQQ